LRVVIDLYPCDILFIHRDAEGQAPENRRTEIATAVQDFQTLHIPVVPVRMTEAWLLIDEPAIRSAADNPNGIKNLNLPAIRNLEKIADPKRVLQEALLRACGLNAGRRSRFDVQRRIHRVPQYLDDFSPLMALPAFQILQHDIPSATQQLNLRDQ
jgi:hypothetical protein